MAAKKKGKLGGGASAAAPKGGDDLLYSAQQIWQAGLGALSRAQAGAPKVFEDLMREGSKLQGGALETVVEGVTGEFFDDTWITTKVKAALLEDPQVKSGEVNVETFKGAVQLSGFVSSNAAMQQAVKVTRGIQGVTSVKNDMRIK